ncbi:MAG: dTMP kinase, partial [Actinomycetota bacterium]|nr:dTMP kinase [Actinomycetota bacterium]
MSGATVGGGATAGAAPRVLAIPAFRRLLMAMALSSFGDWLGLLALMSLATTIAGGDFDKANVAIAGVLILRLAPAVVFGPLAGVVADRLDRRWTMVVADVARFLLFASIPFVSTLWWLLAATFLIEVAAMFWIPAKEATVPNLVPRERLEAANQVSLLATYGAAPVAAAAFAALSLLSEMLDNVVGVLAANPVDLALTFNALTFLFSAGVVYSLRSIRTPAVPTATAHPSVLRTLAEGWRFVGRTPVVRGLVVGMLGAFAAGGAVIGLARTYVAGLGAGDPGFAVLFAAVFLGLAGGMAVGPKVFGAFSRRRLFGLSICGAGLGLALLGLVQNMALAVLFTVVLGAWAGIGWVTGYTLLGLEVGDSVRGRTFAFVQSMVRITLVVVVAVAPLVAAAVGSHSVVVNETITLTYHGAALTLLIAAVLAILLGVTSYRHMDDRKGTPLLADLRALVTRAELPARRAAGSWFVAIEGGEGGGKSTLARRLGAELGAGGREVVLTREPGSTAVGRRLREILLDPATGALAPRTEALLYAADRAEHVATVIRPGLVRGAVVITDRYVDSSVAYQGAGRVLPDDEIARLSQWATDGLLPDLTIVLDVPPEIGLRRSAEPADRLEAEPLEFHRRVRERFLA